MADISIFFLKIDVVYCSHVQSYHSPDEATTSMILKFAAVNKYNMNIGMQNLVQTELFNFFLVKNRIFE